ncbi:hypothetical protein R6X41_08615 [Formosa sp. PL04]|nr:hypothetical protein [Formosa sp. PL04]
MSGFKLLGIKTKDRVDIENDPTLTDYLKVLKENTYYSFYSSYEFDSKTETFTYFPENDVDLYSICREDQNPLHVNISAIVGENGAGKSTLIELLFLGIHNLAVAYKILKNPEDLSSWHTEEGVHLDIYYSVNDKIYCIRLDDLDVCFSSQSKKADNSFSKFKDFKKYDTKNKKDLEFFFYSIAINYSLYGLNTNHVGEWIRALFHKNDGYQTPLVINPMRIKGQIDVNREEGLAKSRLISNLLIETKSNEHLKLSKKQIATAITFKLNRRKIENIYDHNIGSDGIWTFEKLNKKTPKLLDIIYKGFEIDNRDVEIKFKEEIEKYIIKKLFKIARTYDKYKVFLTDNSGNNKKQPSFTTDEKHNLESYIEAIKKDDSHITFKLNQAINYIKKNPLVEDENYKWNKENEHFHIPIKELSKRINTSKLSEIINLIPPSLFNIEIHLEEIESKENKSVFSGLSSGEQQLIHSVQSILYHIINVNSVFSNNSPEDINYAYINLILDEIELYFHPAHQKEFIQHILTGIKSLDIPNIKGINMLFSTHSPFILSDIPSSNILKLRKGEAIINEQLTFGANIHDLLANDFFLKDGFMGVFSQNEIKNVIEALNYTHLNNLKIEKQNQVNLTDEANHKSRVELEIKDIEHKLSKTNKPNEKYNKEYCKKVIEVVGEPILYMSLIELYTLAYKNSKDAFIDEQIANLNKLR